MAWAGGIEEENGDAEKIDEVLEFGLMESGGERCGELLGRLGTIHHELVTAILSVNMHYIHGIIFKVTGGDQVRVEKYFDYKWRRMPVGHRLVDS